MAAPNRTTSRGLRRGSLIGAVMLAALVLYQLMPGGGQGDGPSNEPTDDPLQATLAEPPSPPTQDPGDTDQNAVLTLLIDEYDYFVEATSTDEPTFAPAQLAQIIDLAKRTRGDANGIRVRVLRRENARAAAEHRLQQALHDVGVSQDAIFVTRELLPSSN